MSLGVILVILFVIFLLGGFSGRFGGYGYGFGHGGVGVIGDAAACDLSSPESTVAPLASAAPS